METPNSIPFNMWDRPSVPEVPVPVLDGWYEKLDGHGGKMSYLFREGKIVCVKQQLKPRKPSSCLLRRIRDGSHDTPSTSGTSPGSPSTTGASDDAILADPSTIGAIFADPSTTRIGDDDLFVIDANPDN